SKLIARAEEGICAVTGTSGKALAGRILAQLQSLQIGEPVLENRLGLAVDVLAELRPTSALELLLAVQMFGTHQAAILFLRNAVAEDQSPEGRDAHVARSTKLMGLFLLAQLRRHVSDRSLPPGRHRLRFAAPLPGGGFTACGWLIERTQAGFLP